jgi:hypothetical protein
MVPPIIAKISRSELPKAGPAATITGFEHLASYNWLSSDATILSW